MASFILILSIIYLIVSIFITYLLVGGGIYFKAKIFAMPSFLLSFSCIAQYVAIYLGMNKLFSLSIILFIVASDLFMNESVKAERHLGKLGFIALPPIIKIFDNINAPVSFLSSILSYGSLALLLYDKFVK